MPGDTIEPNDIKGYAMQAINAADAARAAMERHPMSPRTAQGWTSVATAYDAAASAARIAIDVQPPSILVVDGMTGVWDRLKGHYGTPVVDDIRQAVENTPESVTEWASINEGAKLRDVESLEEAIGQTVGHASVCWENPSGAGVFDSSRAKVVVDALKTWMRGNPDKVLEALGLVGVREDVHKAWVSTIAAALYVMDEDEESGENDPILVGPIQVLHKDTRRMRDVEIVTKPNRSGHTVTVERLTKSD